MKDIVGDYRERFRLQRKALRRYTALLLALAMITTLFVNWQLHSDGIAATAQYQCNQEEHTHTADCYTKVLVCGYEEGQPEDWNATFDDSASLDESIGVDAEDDGIALFSAEPEYIYVPHEHTDDCYQEVKTLTCLEEEHVHGDDCFDPEDGSLICEQFEHVHDDSCYTTDYELVCGLEDGELVEELNPAYTAVAAFEAPVAAKPVVVSPVIEAPIHYHTDDCYEEVLTCGLEEHHHTVNCLADPLADVEDESEWLAKTSTSLSGDWSADLLTVAQSQLGYTQSEKNFEVDADDGVTVRHYTRYGEWYGNPYGEWDVMFLSYCLNYAGIPQSAIPQRAGVLALRSDLRGAGYLMDPQSIPAAQQDAIALCDEGLLEEESFADADADDLGFADSASSFCSIQPGDIVFYNTMVTETVAVDDTPAVVEDDSPDADIALLSLDPVETEPQTEQRTVTYETVGIVSDVDEDAGTLSVISGNVDGNVAEVPLNASDVTALVSVASAQAVAGDGTDTLEPPYVAYFDEFPDGNGAGITRIDIVIDNSPVNSNMEITSGTTVSLTFHYSVDGSVLEEGEYVLNYKLPNGIAPPEELTRDITYNGHVIGTQVIRTDGTTTLTFNDDCGNYINLNDPFVCKFTLNWKSVTKEGESQTDIIIPGSPDTIITVKDPTGLKVKKEGKIDTTGKKLVHYTVTISSTGWKKPIDIKDTLSGTGVNGIYVKDTFTLKKIDANKNESTLSDTPTITDTGFSYTSLPALVKEETYVLTYDVAYDITSAQGDAQLDNRVQVDEDHRDDASVEFKERIKKSGTYDPDTGLITWTVTVQNPYGEDLDGWTVTDTHTNDATITGNITVTNKEKTSETFAPNTGDGFTYTFKSSSAVGSTSKQYQFVYTTNALTDGVTNTATLSKGDESYTAKDTEKPTAPKWNAKKSTNADDLTPTETEGIYSAAWKITSPVGTGKKDFTDTTSSGIEHYTYAADLLDMIKTNLKFYLSGSDETLGYDAFIAAGGAITLTCYSGNAAKGTTVPNTNQDTKVLSFKLSIDPSKYTGGSLKNMELCYNTLVDLSNVAEGSTVKIANKCGSDASYSYTKPRQSAALEKGVRKGTNDKITNSSPSWHKYEKTQTVDKYDPASEQQFSYQLMLDVSSWNSFKDHDTVTITDTLPDGLTYCKDSKSPLFGFRMTDNSGKTVGSISSKITTSVTQEGQTLTFTLSGLSSISDADAAQIRALVIRYTVKVNDSEWTTNPRLESKSYTNTASCDALNLNAEAFVTLNRNVKVLTKKGEQVGKTGNVHYTVVINPTARQLGDGGMVTVTDTLGVCTKNVSAELDYSSIQLYDYPKTNISEPLPTTQYNVSEMSLTGTAEKEPYKTYTFTVDVPDARAFVLEYTINTDASTDVKLKNTVSISGQKDTGSDTTDIGTIDGDSTVDQGRLLIHKVDKLNPGTALNGAVFKLERFDSEKGSWEVLNSTALTTKKVDGTDGVIVIPFGNRGDLSVPDKNLFRLTEETAPTGYKKSDEVFYFIWMNTQSDTTITPEAAYQAAVGDKTTDSNGNALPKQPDVTFYGNQKEYSLYVPNERTYLTIQKFWVDEDGRALNGNDVNAESITVNLYSYKKGSDKATASVKTITLEKAYKWVYTVTDGIDTDHIYYIEEADSGNLYEVSYNTTVGVTGGGLLTVTNKLTPAGGYELPSTGGAGTTLYTAVGGTMVLAALVCGFCQKRRRERRAD